jgi:hypothetical protein
MLVTELTPPLSGGVGFCNRASQSAAEREVSRYDGDTIKMMPCEPTAYHRQ